MSRSKYPRFGKPTKHYKDEARENPNFPVCEICGEPTHFRIHMEVDYMRGNDESFFVCKEHYNLAKLSGDDFYDAYWDAQKEKENV